MQFISVIPLDNLRTLLYAISSVLWQEVSRMPTVWLICPDAALREQLLRSLRDGEQMTVCVKTR